MAFSITWCNLAQELKPDLIDRVPVKGIDPETVTARNVAGEIVSRFKDDSWDCRAYGATCPFHFTFWNKSKREPMNKLARTLTNEIKLIHWLMQNNTTANGGRSRGSGYFDTLLVPLNGIVKIAYSLGITLGEAEQSAAFQVALKSSIAGLETGFKSADRLSVLLADLAHFQYVPEIECAVPRLVPEDSLSDVQSLLTRMMRASKEDREQTPLIPTRIFSVIIAGTLEKLNRLEPYLPRLEAFIKAVYSEPYLMADDRYAWKDNVSRVKRVYPEREFLNYADIKSSCVSRSATLDRYGLTDLYDVYGIKSFKDLLQFITFHQTLCVILIHAFSGMRSSEIRVMPYEPVIHQAAKGFGDLPVLVSHLKKFEKANYSQALTWATSGEGIYAVRIAQQLARLNWFRNHPANSALPENAPLWVPTKLNRENPYGHYALPLSDRVFKQEAWIEITQSLGLVIEESDIEELVTFDAFRHWDENPSFSVGSRWPLASHQFRRSVAVYASRSGMVTVPTLKTQFKHLSAIMTALYAENSSYAQSFLIDEKGNPIDNGGVLPAFREAKQFNASLRFHESVIQASETLKGPKGTEIQLAKDRGKLPKILGSREATQKAIKEGKLSYRETPVGGCMYKGICPNFGIDVVLPCTSSCADAILTKDKLKTYVENLRFEQEAMSPESKPYKAVGEEILHITQRYLEPAEETE